MGDQDKIYIRNNNVLRTLNNATAYAGYTQQNVISEIDRKFQPTVETNPFAVNVCNIVRTGVRATTGTSTVYTTPTDKDFYVTAIALGLTKDVTCDAATGRLQLSATIDGSAQVLISIPFLTLTVMDENVSLTLPFPVKIDRNTNITHSLTFTAGAASFTGTVIGFTIDPATYNIGQAEVHK